MATTHDYRVGGDHLRPSDPFFLVQGYTHHTTVGVSPSSTAAHRGGVALAAIGGSAAAFGVAVLAIDFIAAATVSHGPLATTVGALTGTTTSASPDAGWLVAGSVLSGVGVALAVTGIIIEVTHHKTHVTQSPGVLRF